MSGSRNSWKSFPHGGHHLCGQLCTQEGLLEEEHFVKQYALRYAFFLWTSWNYTFHIIAFVPTFLESKTGVDPGFVQIKFFFFIRYQFFIYISYSEVQSKMSARSMRTRRLFMRLFHTHSVSLKTLFKDVPLPSSVNFLLQNWNKFTHGGYDFTLNVEFLYNIY